MYGLLSTNNPSLAWGGYVACWFTGVTDADHLSASHSQLELEFSMAVVQAMTGKLYVPSLSLLHILCVDSIRLYLGDSRHF